MKIIYYFFLSCAISMLSILNACTQEKETEILSTNPESTDSSYWIEIQGKFITHNLEKAQEEIPFPIILPRYLPSSFMEDDLPYIIGPLKEFQKSEEINVNIKYPFHSTIEPQILIEIQNHHIALGNPATEPLKINEISIYYEVGNYVQGPGFIFNFQNDGVYYIVEIFNVTFEESTKIIDSIIIQLQ